MKTEDIVNEIYPKLLALPEDEAKRVLSNLLLGLYQAAYKQGLKVFKERLSKDLENHA